MLLQELANINAVAADATDIGTVAGISADVTAVAGKLQTSIVNANSTNINTVTLTAQTSIQLQVTTQT